MKISYGKNVYGKEEINAVLNQLKKTTQMGSAVITFENKIAKLFSKKYGLMVNSGSSALTLATNVLNFKKGDEIITPCLNFGTALSSIIFSGATPILVDVDVNTLQININKIQQKITKKTKGLIIPNLIGNVPDWKKIKKIAKRYKLKIIEDSADTLGATINNNSTGIYSDISKKISKIIKIPTIGIGASVHCDGQVLVTDDILGLTDAKFKFVKKYVNIKKIINTAISNFKKEVKSKRYPSKKYSY